MIGLYINWNFDSGIVNIFGFPLKLFCEFLVKKPCSFTLNKFFLFKSFNLIYLFKFFVHLCKTCFILNAQVQIVVQERFYSWYILPLEK